MFEEDVFLKTFGIIHMHFISWKLVLNCVFAENFKFSKILSFNFFDQSKLSLDKSKRVVFRPKLTISFDSYSIPFDQSKSVFKIFRLPLNSSRLIEFQNFQFLKRNQISIFQKILSSSSRPLSIPLHFFFSFFFFLSQSFKGFHLLTWYVSFTLFFWVRISYL